MKERYEKNWVNTFNEKNLSPDMGQWRRLQARLEAEGLSAKEDHKPKGSGPSNTFLRWMMVSALVLLMGTFAFAYFQKEQHRLLSKIDRIEKQNAEFRAELASARLQKQSDDIASTTQSSTVSIPQFRTLMISRVPIQRAGANYINFEGAKSENDEGLAIALPSKNLVMTEIPEAALQSKNHQMSNRKAIRKSLEATHKALIRRQVENMEAQRALDASWDEIAALHENRMDKGAELAMGLKGGVLSGDKQNGVLGTFNVGAELASNIILEADMGVVNAMGVDGDIAASSLFKTSSSEISNAPLMADQIQPGSEVYTGSQNIAYLYATFNPTAGYRFSNRIALKMGVDLQNNLSRSDRLTYVQIDNQYYQLAQYDVGLTPKVSYKITPKIEGEFIYRNGLNSALYGEKFWNRNYFFAQLRYRLK